MAKKKGADGDSDSALANSVFDSDGFQAQRKLEESLMG